MKKYNSKLAFSLIELSVVILIIGILVIGITKGSRIIRASKLKTAQSLTNSSPVASTSEIILWYESTLDKSFVASEMIDTSLASTGTISTWYDINPHSTTQNNAAQVTSTNRPRYRAAAINGLPALNFDGSDNYLNFDGTRLVNTDYTVFVVDQRRAGGTMFFLGGANTSANQVLDVGYVGTNKTYWDQYLTYPQYDIPAYSVPIPRIHSLVSRGGVNKNYYLNGGTNPIGTMTGGYAQNLTSYNGATIGALVPDSYYYNGDIGEIIMFSRALNNAERVAIEKYLKAKWGIK